MLPEGQQERQTKLEFSLLANTTHGMAGASGCYMIQRYSSSPVAYIFSSPRDAQSRREIRPLRGGLWVAYEARSTAKSARKRTQQRKNMNKKRGEIMKIAFRATPTLWLAQNPKLVPGLDAA